MIIEVVLIRSKKVRVQQEQKAGPRRMLMPVDSMILHRETRSMEEVDGVKTNYTIKLAPYSFSNEICADTSINIPLKLEKQETAAATVTSSPSSETIRISKQVNRRTLKFFRKLAAKENSTN